MTIPPNYQIFDAPVRLTDKDCDRLRPHLRSWVKLNELLLLGINEPDLQRLVVVELLFAKRPQILKRLLSRLGRMRQEQLWARVEGILSI